MKTKSENVYKESESKKESATKLPQKINWKSYALEFIKKKKKKKKKKKLKRKTTWRNKALRLLVKNRLTKMKLLFFHQSQ